jgi:hypothetical protein
LHRFAPIVGKPRRTVGKLLRPKPMPRTDRAA